MTTNMIVGILESQVYEAKLDLDAARHAFEHSPNSDSERTMQYAEHRMNKLLDALSTTR